MVFGLAEEKGLAATPGWNWIYLSAGSLLVSNLIAARKVESAYGKAACADPSMEST
jgi:hypothetical protein